MKLFNAHIARMDEQITRCLVIHQTLGMRISDTLTLRRDCLYNEHGQNMIRIHQVKTDTYDKSIRRELVMPIQKAAEYTAGKPFQFNSHMFRHYYGVKLTEMHLDD